MLESRFFYYFVTILMHFLVLYSVIVYCPLWFFLLCVNLLQNEMTFCSSNFSIAFYFFLQYYFSSACVLLRKFIILGVHLISLAIHCIKNMHFLLVSLIISLVSFSYQGHNIEIHYKTWCLCSYLIFRIYCCSVRIKEK